MLRLILVLSFVGSMWGRPLATLLLATRVMVRMLLVWTVVSIGWMQSCAGASSVWFSGLLVKGVGLL